MDPITGAVVAIVIWAVLIFAGWVVIYIVGGLIGGLISDSPSGLVIGAVIGYVGGAAWAIFALIQAILEVVHLIQLISG